MSALCIGKLLMPSLVETCVVMVETCVVKVPGDNCVLGTSVVSSSRRWSSSSE